VYAAVWLPGLEPAGSRAVYEGLFKEAGQLVGGHLVEREHHQVAYVKPMSTTATVRAGWSQCIKELKRTAGQGKSQPYRMPDGYRVGRRTSSRGQTPRSPCTTNRHNGFYG